MGVDENCTRLR